MAKVKFSPDAITDLEQIKKYISEELGSVQAANNVLTKIMKQVKRLSDFPLSGPSLSSIINFETNYRYVVCGNYTAFYRYDEGIVYVLRVIYGRRDFMRILFGEPYEN